MKSTETQAARPWRSPLLPLSRRATFGLAFALALLAALWFLDVATALGEFLGWVEDIGWYGPPLFIVLHATAVTLLFPGILFPLGAGFLYGPFLGTVVSTLGKTLGSTSAFFIARYLLDEPDPRQSSSDSRRARARRIAAFKERHPKLRLLDRHLPEGGWRVVALIRLVPVIPYKLSNYFFGWSRFRRRDFILGTLLGSIPYSFTNAWIGSLAADLSSLTENPLPATSTEWVLSVCGLILALSAATAITRRARRILAAGTDALDSST